MPKPKELRVGIVGYKFMGKAHSHAYIDLPKFFPDAPKPVLKAICGRDEAGVKQAMQTFGWESYETDWEKLVARDDIDLVDISTPNDSHRDIAVAAAKNGKHVFTDKPMAMNLQQAREMLDAAEKAKVKHFVGFNYRRVPAVALAKKYIEEGRVGKIYHWRAVYLQDWIVDPDFPLVWRLDKNIAGSGAIGDLASHIIDLAQFLVGGIESISAMTETFIKERPLATAVSGLAAAAGKEKKERGKVTVDDCALMLARFKNGAVGTFEVTRFATGRKNYNCFEINGSEGSLAFNLERMNELQYHSHKDADQGWSNIMVTQPYHPYLSAWWPPGHIIGWEHTHIHQTYDLFDAIASDRMPSPSFRDGVKNQAVLEAVSASAQSGKWEKVPE